ncbi:hypothetical protein AIOGIFDO_00636 [Candidatus Methanoperedenaceae archaeon GB37]|nr:hypothetical protein AIOGIFDO_00636 [Candidatus Methanoperedenaceae archaeon GB37]
MREKSYYNNIHDIVKINSNFLFPGFKPGEVSDPDITIEIKKDIDFSKEGLSRLDFWFYGKEGGNFVHFEDNFFGMKNKVLLKNLEGQTEVFCNKSVLRLDRFYPPRSRKSFKDLIDTIIRIKQIKKGYLNIHASCLSRDGSAILFAAFPNVGKTLSTLQLLKKGFKYLSDDTVLVDRNGKAYLTSFPSAIGYEDFLKFINPTDIRTRKYYKTLVKDWLIKHSNILNRVMQPPLICLGDLFETVDESKVDVVCTLEIGERKIREVDKEYMAEKITTINDYSLSRINNPFIFVYSYFNDSSVGEIERMQKENLLGFLEGCRCYSLACNDWNWMELISEVIE